MKKINQVTQPQRRERRQPRVHVFYYRWHQAAEQRSTPWMMDLQLPFMAIRQRSLQHQGPLGRRPREERHSITRLSGLSLTVLLSEKCLQNLSFMCFYTFLLLFQCRLIKKEQKAPVEDWGVDISQIYFHSWYVQVAWRAGPGGGLSNYLTHSFGVWKNTIFHFYFLI